MVPWACLAIAGVGLVVAVWTRRRRSAVWTDMGRIFDEMQAGLGGPRVGGRTGRGSYGPLPAPSRPYTCARPAGIGVGASLTVVGVSKWAIAGRSGV
jgi:hypothetical protein